MKPKPKFVNELWLYNYKVERSLESQSSVKTSDKLWQNFVFKTEADQSLELSFSEANQSLSKVDQSRPKSYR